MTFRPEMRSLSIPVIFGVLCSLFIWIGGMASYVLAFLFFILFFYSMFYILFQSKPAGEEKRYRSYALFAEQYNKLDPVGRQALGIKFPWIDVDISSYEPEQRLGGTSVPIEFFIKFLKGSNPHQVWPLRNLKVNKEIIYWHEIVDLLAKYGYITKDASGNHSHRWIGKWQTKLYFAFIKTDVREMKD